MPDVNERLAKIEQKMDSHFEEQSKKNKVLFELLNDKVIPTVQIAQDTKEDLKDHIANHTRGIILACSVIGAISVILNFAFQVMAKK